MDFLEPSELAIERFILFRAADPLDLGVDTVFYDTTSPHFEVTEEAQRRPGRYPQAGENLSVRL